MVIGPVSHLDYPPKEKGGGNPSGGLRIALDLYANIRPADLLEGRLSFMFDRVDGAAPHVNGGRLRAFAVVGPGRAKALPKVPTMSEAGFGGFEEEFARRMRKAK